MYQNLVPDLFLLLVNNLKQPLYARNYFENKILKVDYQKALKKSILFFLPNPAPFNGQSYQKQRGLELVASHLSGYKTTSEKFLY